MFIVYFSRKFNPSHTIANQFSPMTLTGTAITPFSLFVYVLKKYYTYVILFLALNKSIENVTVHGAIYIIFYQRRRKGIGCVYLHVEYRMHIH